MKKLLILWVLPLLFISLASAVSTDLHENYMQKETMIAEISGNILQPITDSQIELKRGHVQVPFDYEIQKLGDNYFIYGIAPASENFYTLVINNIQTTQNGVVTTLDFEQNFSTTNETSPYTIKPGFASAQNEFDLTVTSNIDINQVVQTEFPDIAELTIKPGDNKFTIQINSLPAGLSRIAIGDYSFPIYHISEDSSGSSSNQSNIPTHEFALYPKSIESTVLVNQEISYPFRFVNLGNQPIENVKFVYDTSLFDITPVFEGPLDPEQALEFQISVLSHENNINDKIKIIADGQETELPILVYVTSNSSQVQTPYLNEFQNNQSGYLCSELEGTFCSAEETCSESPVSALDGNSCCLGTCQSNKSSGSSLAWIGWLIGALILIVGVIILGRYLKTKNSKSKINPITKGLKP